MKRLFAILGVANLIFGGAGLYLYFSHVVRPDLACLVAGILCLLAGVGCFVARHYEEE